MTTMEAAFEEDLIDALILFTRNREEIASISFFEFKTVEEVYPILEYFQENITKALEIFQASNFPIHPVAESDCRSQITLMREEVENHLEFAISPWTLRASIRYRFVKLLEDRDVSFIRVTMFLEIRSVSDDENTVVMRHRLAIPLTLPLGK